MKKLTLLMTLLALLCAAGLTRAADQPTAFEQANAAFAEKNYAPAEHDYQAILTKQGFSAAVLFNLANAYERDGKLGLAILNYERAALLAPRDAAIAANLGIARAQAGLADRPMAWFEEAARLFSLNTLSWLAGAAVLFIAAGLGAGPFISRHRFGWRVWMTTAICGLVAVAMALFSRRSELNRAIVTVQQAPAYIAPVTIGQPVFTLTEGYAVALGRQHGDFVLVETRAGQRGWVKREDVSRLIPETQRTQITKM